MIYFIQDGPEGPIKIGTTACLSQRFQNLRTDHGKDLRLLAVLGGCRSVERNLHRRFWHLRVKGEWFSPGEDLLGFIASEGKSWDGRDELRSVKLHADVVRLARIVAAYRNENITDLLSDILEPILKEMEREGRAKRNALDPV